MKPFILLLLIILSGFVTPAAEITVSNGTTVCILPGAYPNYPVSAFVDTSTFPTNPVLGDLAVTNKFLVQYTSTGWQPTLRSRQFLAVSIKTLTTNTLELTVHDKAGALYQLTDSTRSLLLASPSYLSQLPIWVTVTNGDAVVFAAQR